MNQLLLVYLFICFSIGLVCIGVVIALVQQSHRSVARAFLAFYVFLTISVLAGLMLAYLDVSGATVAESRTVLEYLESMISFYGMMVTLPLFVHRVFAIENPNRDRILISIVAIAFVGQHITEYGLGKWWDSKGDLFENLLFAAIGIYVAVVATRKFNSPDVDRILAFRVLALVVVSAPAMLHDLFLIDFTGLRFYPFLFALSSIVIAWTLFDQTSPPAEPLVREPSIPAEWNLTERETEVVFRVLEGLSNKEIGSSLFISVNTVKTHLRAVFEKSGCHSRFSLMAAVACSHWPSAKLVQKPL